MTIVRRFAWQRSLGATPPVGAAFAAGAIAVLAFADGGFFPSAWGAATVAFAAVAGLSLVVRRPEPPTRSQILAVAGMAAVASWTVLSALWWSPDEHASLLEARRTAVYVTLLVAALLVRGPLLSGALAGIAFVCAYAVGRRLLEGAPNPPDPFEGTLLKEPLGYANALGGLAAIGLAAAVGLLVLGRRPRLALLGVVAVFVATLVLTESRGGWAAALVGGLLAAALGSGRRRLALGVASAAALALVVVLTLPAGSLADDLARHGGDRPWYWHVAWEEVREAPLVGGGAGTFQRAWLERQPVPVEVRDAHSLYLETLAELGLVGLALLALALAAPLLHGFGPRANAAALGGYAAFLVHAGLDWDWEMPAVTVAGLLCGAALLDRSRREERKFRRRASSTAEKRPDRQNPSDGMSPFRSTPDT